MERVREAKVQAMVDEVAEDSKVRHFGLNRHERRKRAKLLQRIETQARLEDRKLRKKGPKLSGVKINAHAMNDDDTTGEFVVDVEFSSERLP